LIELALRVLLQLPSKELKRISLEARNEIPSTRNDSNFESINDSKLQKWFISVKNGQQKSPDKSGL